MRKNTKKRQNLKGFTLVEIIVVLVIIGILASVTIAALTGYIDKSKDRVAVLEAKRWYIAAQAAVSEVYADGTITMKQGKPTYESETMTIDGMFEGVVGVERLGQIQVKAKNGNFPSVSGNNKIAALTLQYMGSLDNRTETTDFDFPIKNEILNMEESDITETKIGSSQTPDEFFKSYDGDTYVYITFNDDGKMTSVTYAKRGYSGVVKLTRNSNGFDYVIKDTDGSKEKRK